MTSYVEKCTNVNEGKSEEQELQEEHIPVGKYEVPPKKLKKGKLPNSFMGDPEVAAKFEDLIEEPLENGTTQELVDKVYDDLVDTYLTELGKCLKELDRTPKAKRLARHSCKPYWDEHLTALWKTCHEAEHTFLRTPKNTPGYIGIEDHFIWCQRVFDRENRRCRRSYNRSKVYSLEKANEENPVEFWQTILNMGPKKSSKIPWVVVNEDNTVTTDKRRVLHK